MALFAYGDLDPVQGLLELQRELDRFTGKPGLFGGPSGGGVFPPINVFSDAEGIVVRAEVPGVDPNALNVALERRTLTISGERTEPAHEKGAYHRRERAFGKFSRSLQLPEEFDSEHAAAECRHGMLTVRIPKRAEARPRQVKVNIG